MKFTKQRIKKIIKEEIDRLAEGHYTKFSDNLDDPDPPNAVRMEAVSKAVENQIFNDLEEIIVKWGNIVVTTSPNSAKVEQMAEQLRSILYQAGLRMPDHQKLAEIEKEYEEDYMSDEEWIEKQKAKDPNWEKNILDQSGYFDDDEEFDVDDI
tara:strand:- start:177 stop:635 length:459 start_codon:yes stop_codon:yes gene_type:complete